MTFALIADGRIVDHVDAATLEDLSTWIAGRRTPLAFLSADSAHRDHADRSIVITRIGHRDRSVATLE